MVNFQSGVLDKTRLFSNFLMLVLLAGNIYFSIQYTTNIHEQDAKTIADSAKVDTRLQIAKFQREFVEVFLNTKGVIPFDDRVKLENDLRQLHDPDLTGVWDKIVSSKDSKSAQASVVKFLGLLSNKMII